MSVRIRIKEINTDLACKIGTEQYLETIQAVLFGAVLFCAYMYGITSWQAFSPLLASACLLLKEEISSGELMKWVTALSQAYLCMMGGYTLHSGLVGAKTETLDLTFFVGIFMIFAAAAWALSARRARILKIIVDRAIESQNLNQSTGKSILLNGTKSYRSWKFSWVVLVLTMLSFGFAQSQVGIMTEDSSATDFAEAIIILAGIESLIKVAAEGPPEHEEALSKLHAEAGSVETRDKFLTNAVLAACCASLILGLKWPLPEAPIKSPQARCNTEISASSTPDGLYRDGKERSLGRNSFTMMRCAAEAARADCW